MRASLFAATLLLALSARAEAQPYLGRSAPRAGSFEIGGSVVRTRGYDAGSRSALESPNTTSGAPPLTLFTLTSRMEGATGGEARVGVYLAPRVLVEGSVRYSRPTLRATLADDFENAEPATAGEVIASYVVGGSFVYHFGEGRFVPFVIGGAGYLRQLHEDNAEVLTGTEVHAGGGVKYWLGTGSRRLGLRVDAQASSRSKSAAFEQKRRIVPVVSAGLSYLF